MIGRDKCSVNSGRAESGLTGFPWQCYNYRDGVRVAWAKG
jgi:hypothetical protein